MAKGTGNLRIAGVPDQVSMPHMQRELGRQLALFRQAAGYTQEDLSCEIGYSRSTVANVEVGRQRGACDFWERCDRELDADGVLVGGYGKLTDMEMRRHHEEILRIKAERDARRIAKGTVCPAVPLLQRLIGLIDGALSMPEGMSGKDKEG